MAIGVHPKTGNIPGFSAPVVYDKGVMQSAKPRVLQAKFGDGYEMRVRDGINNTPREWSQSFKTRTKADIDNLYDFFNGLASVDTCKLTVPFDGGESTAVVVIEEYSRTLDYDEFYSLNCKAREVFEA